MRTGEIGNGWIWQAMDPQDRYGHAIYLTQERWEPRVDPANPPEMADDKGYLRETIRLGRRRQEPLNPRSIAARTLLLTCRTTAIISRRWCSSRSHTSRIIEQS